ncbi:class I SAM-dependent methyltransferase [Paenibacillus alginolyticus]|uniref:methyltransferase domain-containing protein n=1 Tax=Paenibacillus alginolyticus TaxID=59839 RepID=UPI0003FE0DD4|nr:methyltransferase domain-containing protein [Paenibacillus alginolyticus]MCY9664830.1 class I SAM-dependent methyltransferase [Paenibacillus alginolyticus]
MEQGCPCCNDSKVKFFTNRQEYDYFSCKRCESIFISPDILEKIDNGYSVMTYDEGYWKTELASSFERSYGVALARMSEVFYYARSQINRFIDIGTGPGYFLDAIHKLLPDKAHIFYGIEKFPPSDLENRTKHENYFIGDMDVFKTEKFDAGMCIEVIEHITPNMLKSLLSNLALISNENAVYLFNTGMPDYVVNEDNEYLDPHKRGHIVSYSLKAINILASQFGFKTHSIRGKTWAFILEFKPNHKTSVEMVDRIWTAVPENLQTLTDKNMGSVLRLLGMETSRAYY